MKKIQRVTTIAIGAAVAALILDAAPALAQTPAEASCRGAIAKNVNGYLKSVMKTYFKCHIKRSKGKISPAVDCNDIAEADPQMKLEKKRNKLRKVIGGATDACPGQATVLANYDRCPSPAEDVDDGAPTDGIDTFQELAECLIGLSDGMAGLASREVLGMPPGKLEKPAAKCQKTMGKRIAKLFAAYGSVRSNCQSDRDSQMLGLDYGCGDFDSTKIDKALGKLKSDIAKRCDLDDDPVLTTREEINELGACGDSVAQLQACAGDVVGARMGAGLIAMAYELPTFCRAGSVQRTGNARAGAQLTATQLSTGYSGTAQQIDVPDGFSDVVGLACDADCANCGVSIDPVPTEPISFCRCDNDPTVSCDTISGPDDDCGVVNNNCTCFYGPPLAISAGGNPVCVVNKMRQDHLGSVDVGAGEWDDTLHLASVVHLGIDSFNPCPLCEDDVTANDGNRDGTCSGGLQNGQPCDISGTHPTFGAISLDCPPAAIQNISGDGLILSLEFTSFDASLEYELPCDTPGGALCPCRVCSDNVQVGCSSNQDCADVGAGTCTGGGGAGVQPNECSDFTCSSEGICDAGPIDTYCDGTLTADGRGYISCLNDADCQTQSLGNCSVSENRRCYTNPIEVSGEPGAFGGVNSAAFCIPPTTSAAVNETGGLPGAGTFDIDFDTTVRCATDPSSVWEPPGGSNCGMVTTTTTLPPQPCGSTFPVCDGECPGGMVCENQGVNCGCVTPPTTTTTTLLLPACMDTIFPVCGGTCPLGTTCQGEDIGQPCACLP